MKVKTISKKVVAYFERDSAERRSDQSNLMLGEKQHVCSNMRCNRNNTKRVQMQLKNKSERANKEEGTGRIFV